MKMNEQFSRLYHLAWNYSEFDDEYQEKPTYERRCVVQSRIFAELIVRECSARLLHDDFSSVKGVMSIAGARLKEHFGVEP